MPADYRRAAQAGISHVLPPGGSTILQPSAEDRSAVRLASALAADFSSSAAFEGTKSLRLV
jgi:hypothetical protein